MFLLLYVDDMILAGKDRCKIESVKEKLKGMVQNEKGLFLNQSYYMELLLKPLEGSQKNFALC